MCAAPRAPPPLSARPILGRDLSSDDSVSCAFAGGAEKPVTSSEVLANIANPFVHRKLGVTQVGESCSCDPATRTPAHHRGDLLACDGIHRLALCRCTAETETRYLGVNRDVENTDGLLDLSQTQTNPGDAGPGFRNNFIAVTLRQLIG